MIDPLEDENLYTVEWSDIDNAEMEYENYINDIENFFREDFEEEVTPKQNTMKALEELTQDIREKLPRLVYKDKIEDIDPQTGFTFKTNLLVPEEPMLNNVLDWMPFVDERELLLDYYGNIGEIICDRGGYYLNPLVKWDLSKPYLKDQSLELITFLHSLIKTKQ